MSTMSPSLPHLVHRKVVSPEELPHRSIWQKIFTRKERYWKEARKIARHNRRLRRYIFGSAFVVAILIGFALRIKFHAAWKTVGIADLSVFLCALFMYTRHKEPDSALVTNTTSNPFEKKLDDE